MTGQTTGGPTPVDLSVIIINWKSVQYLGPCLRALYEHTSGIDFEVIVLDNASYDGSAELIKTEYPQVLFIQSDQNHGFTQGNNVAFRHSNGKNILLLNPDTEILGNAISNLLSCLDALPRSGAVGCRLLNSDGSIQTTCLQAFPTILNQILDVDFLKRMFPVWSLWGMRPLFRDPGTPVEVDMICGACILLKRSVFEEVGLLSPDYLMYGDDLDLCYKVKKAGYGVYYTGDAAIIHHGGKSSDSLKQGLADVWTRVAVYKFMVKAHGRVYGIFYRATLAALAALRLVLIACTRPFGNIAERTRREATFLKWKRILQWAMGGDAWAHVAGKEAGLATRSW
jgi:GT2 family glycosyltransferase